MERAKSILGYFAAALTILGAILTPFVLIPLFVRAVGAAGIRPDPSYSGGDVVRTLSRGTYRIEIHRPVERRTPFQSLEPFVQVDWSPVGALPEVVREELDTDGDGVPDFAVSFTVPRDPKVPLSAEVRVMNGRFKPVTCLRKDSFDALIVRAEERIILRVPLASGRSPSKNP